MPHPGCFSFRSSDDRLTPSFPSATGRAPVGLTVRRGCVCPAYYRSSRRWWMVLTVVVAGACCAACSSAPSHLSSQRAPRPGPTGAPTGETVGTAPNPTTTTTAPPVITMTISGTGPAVDVTVVDGPDESQHNDVALPYSVTLQDMPEIAGINAQTSSGSPSATISCTVDYPGRDPVVPGHDNQRGGP